MPNKKTDTSTADPMRNMFDGTRHLIADTPRVSIRIIYGNRRQWYGNYRKGPSHYVNDMPAYPSLIRPTQQFRHPDCAYREH